MPNSTHPFRYSILAGVALAAAGLTAAPAIPQTAVTAFKRPPL